MHFRLRLLLSLLPLLLCAACASLPTEVERLPSHAMTRTDDTRLGRGIAGLSAGKPADHSAIHPLPDPLDAFAARVLLARAADRSLDVQYYIWRQDHTGLLLFEALWEAAERGVRVRLLLDDNNTGGLDNLLATLDAHPLIEVRLYNPLAMRSTRMLNYLGEFERLNRRMHNKSMTADNQATIVGGRNIGDEYFDAGDGVGFQDLDVLAAGPVVRAVSSSFDAYWNSASAFPVTSVVSASVDRAALLARFTDIRNDDKAKAYQQRVRDSGLLQTVLDGRFMGLEWAPTTLVVDPPTKTLGDTASAGPLLMTQLLDLLGQPRVSFDLVTPYFVPGPQGSAAFSRLAQQGVRVRILTNSLSSTDVSAVHAGYAKRRKDLLRAGVTLYELKREKSERAAPSEKDTTAGQRQPGKHFGSSSASLHAKTFAQDGQRAFVGSFNFDPRSAHLNTELGVVIDSPALASAIGRWFDTRVSHEAYHVLIDDSDRLHWVEQTASGATQYDTEPGTNALRRGWIYLLSILPIEWLL
ncbi:phospholipase D family protein [Uliginosibacterium sp. H1]|uniref:phospholipase D family protein n=1 Tax=Uliginosibacterium sp. H1 TaxID=3114757 RepID=UPI002E197943|nr:phospholipase D family protein [Uliginosibacterium sp. H1]